AAAAGPALIAAVGTGGGAVGIAAAAGAVVLAGGVAAATVWRLTGREARAMDRAAAVLRGAADPGAPTVDVWPEADALERRAIELRRRLSVLHAGLSTLMDRIAPRP
ncbi:MAG: hypothetical protein AAFU61_18515, partial [Pseudomonadota bacterium]